MPETTKIVLAEKSQRKLIETVTLTVALDSVIGAFGEYRLRSVLWHSRVAIDASCSHVIYCTIIYMYWLRSTVSSAILDS